jgi:hypothetical protein
LFHALQVAAHAYYCFLDVVSSLNVAVLKLEFCGVAVLLQGVVEFAEVLFIRFGFAKVDLFPIGK